MLLCSIMPNRSGAGGQRRLIFTGNVKTNLFNKYTPGSGVGSLNRSVKRILNRRATSSNGSLDSNGKLIQTSRCCQFSI
jgi:hypothetical protein